MFYYVVNAVTTTKVDGTEETNPDIPIGTKFVSATLNGSYLVGINEEIVSLTDKKLVSNQQIESAAISVGSTLKDVLTWFVGDS